MLRHVLQRADIGGDVLALAAVAAGRAGDKFAVFVPKRHRQAVDLRLGGKRDRLVFGKPQEAPNAADEIDHVLVGKRIVEREHRNGVTNLGETRRRRRADALRETVARLQLRKTRFNRRITLAQPVILGIRDRWRILLVIAPVMLGDFRRKPRVLGFRLFFREVFD